MYIYKWHEVDQTKHEIFCVHIVCNEIQVKVNLEITTFFFYLRFPYCPNFFWFGVVVRLLFKKAKKYIFFFCCICPIVCSFLLFIVLLTVSTHCCLLTLKSSDKNGNKFGNADFAMDSCCSRELSSLINRKLIVWKWHALYISTLLIIDFS